MADEILKMFQAKEWLKECRWEWDGEIDEAGQFPLNEDSEGVQERR